MTVSFKPNVTFLFLFEPAGDPGQYAVDAEDVGGDGDMQRRASPPTGSGGEPAGFLQSQTSAAAAGGARTSHPAASRSAGGTAGRLNVFTHSQIIDLICDCRKV